MPSLSISRTPRDDNVMIIPCGTGPNGEALETLLSQIREQKDTLNSQCAAVAGGLPYQQVNELAEWKETAFNPKVNLGTSLLPVVWWAEGGELPHLAGHPEGEGNLGTAIL